MKILALDLGSTMGWAFRDETTHTSGIWNLTRRNTLHLGYKYLTLWNSLEMFRQVRGIPEDVVYERPGVLFGNAKKVIPGIQAIIEMWSLTHGCKISCVSPTEVKKHATGKGKADKERMIEVTKKAWPHVEIKTHDQCDALWILDHFLFTNGYDRLAAKRPGFDLG